MGGGGVMYYQYTCNQCGADQEFESYRGSYVCPWCGEGVMQFVEESGEEDEEL